MSGGPVQQPIETDIQRKLAELEQRIARMEHWIREMDKRLKAGGL